MKKNVGRTRRVLFSTSFRMFILPTFSICPIISCWTPQKPLIIIFSQPVLSQSPNHSTMASKRIIQLNKDAIFFLREGDHLRTKATLLTAYAFLDGAAQAASQTQDSLVNTPGQTLHPLKSLGIPDSPLEQTNHNASTGNDLFTCYRRALSVQKNDDVHTHFKSRTRMSAVLQYNLALSHHNEGIQKNSHKDLAIALQLYEGAYFTIERVKDMFRMEEVFLLLLGIFFNMTHIHCNLFNIAECEHCMEWLKVALASRECVTLQEVDYLFFSTNVSLLSIQMPRLAPAA